MLGRKSTVLEKRGGRAGDKRACHLVGCNARMCEEQVQAGVGGDNAHEVKATSFAKRGGEKIGGAEDVSGSSK